MKPEMEYSYDERNKEASGGKPFLCLRPAAAPGAAPPGKAAENRRQDGEGQGDSQSQG
jgi:hypothetical protein